MMDEECRTQRTPARPPAPRSPFSCDSCSPRSQTSPWRANLPGGRYFVVDLPASAPPAAADKGVGPTVLRLPWPEPVEGSPSFPNTRRVMSATGPAEILRPHPASHRPALRSSPRSTDLAGGGRGKRTRTLRSLTSYTPRESTRFSVAIGAIRVIGVIRGSLGPRLAEPAGPSGAPAVLPVRTGTRRYHALSKPKKALSHQHSAFS